MSSKKGFTLIELLVVIAIIGILSSIVLLALRGARTKARDARIIASMAQVRSLAEVLYNSSTDSYAALDPATSTEFAALIADVTAQGGSLTYDIGASPGRYCAVSTLNSGNVYCVDSTGRAFEAATSLCAAGSPVCQ